jgi:hypothetical protein
MHDKNFQVDMQIFIMHLMQILELQVEIQTEDIGRFTRHIMVEIPGQEFLLLIFLRFFRGNTERLLMVSVQQEIISGSQPIKVAVTDQPMEVLTGVLHK